MSNYKVVEIYFNWRTGMTINIPYDAYISICVGILILSLACWVFSKAFKNFGKKNGS